MPRPPIQILVHVVWSTSGRARVLVPDIDRELESILRLKAVQHATTIHAFGAALDHVHVVLSLGARSALADVVGPMKGASSRVLGHHVLLRRKFSWQAGYWAESLHPSLLPAASRYVLAQRLHHLEDRPAERWETDSSSLAAPALSTSSTR